ncbi:hypothetical protein Val02_42980 [Virgisporangium aliadipatigenens]|uniref:Uncharacterized protein n=1 Tax=Virgisporangium aliadipatigenens TaxID=741659 RepID=A0A8J4DSN4_9ACTN|nr:hypothetical protein [Virgisporangium aliadipatigenens]GIJ47412.1 hypothetical protein Val02_42980 [Virgisporangium aliadipatigenens]
MVSRFPRHWLVPALVVLGYVVLQFVNYPKAQVFPDSARYVSQAQQFLGVSEAEANEKAKRLMCDSEAKIWERERRADVRRTFSPQIYQKQFLGCLQNNKDGMYPRGERYQAIFSSRPGYPLLMTPLVGILGPKHGMWATSLLIAIACGLLVFQLLRMLGCSDRVAVAGQVLYYATPIGFWSSRMLAEGPQMLTMLVALIGAVLLIQRRVRPGVGLLVGATVVGSLVKYSSMMLVTAALAAGAVGIWMFARDHRHRGLAWLFGVSSGLTIAISGGTSLAGLPGSSESLQDTFTSHFAVPDVPDPWRRLIVINIRFWDKWIAEQAAAPLLVTALVAGGFFLWRWHRPAALLTIAAALTGLATEVAHPDWLEGDRLYSPVWLLAVVGLPCAVSLAQRTRTPAATQDPAPTTPPAAEPNDEPAAQRV